MRICHVVGGAGGAAEGTLADALALAVLQQQAGARVRVISRRTRDGNAAVADRVPGAAGLELHQLPPSGPLERLAASTLVGTLRRLLADVDVVHLHGVGESLLLRAATLAGERGAPTVYSPHDGPAWRVLLRRRLEGRAVAVLAARPGDDLLEYYRRLPRAGVASGAVPVLERAKPYARAAKYGFLHRRAQWEARLAGPGDRIAVPAPVAFIIACGRSGTTLLGRLFAAHPEVTYWFEPYHLWAAVDPRCDMLNLYLKVEGRALMDRDDASSEAAQRFARLFLERRRREGTALMVEKTPINTLRLGYLEALAPGARYVHIVRDGRDVVRSIDRLATGNTYRIAGRTRMNQWWGVGGAKWTSLARDGAAVGYFADEVASLESHEQRGAYEWLVSLLEVDRHREALGGRLLEFTYADLTRDPRKTLARVCEFLDLSVPDSWLDGAISTVDRTRRNEPSPVILPPAMGRAFRELQQRYGFRGEVRIKSPGAPPRG